METAKRLEAARRALARAEESVGLSSAPSGAEAPAGEWSVPDALSWLFPRGLSRGMTVGVRGSRLAALLVAGIASGAGAWSVFLGCAGTGWAVAASLGVDLDRTVCVPRVGEAARSQVLAAAVDGFDVAVIGSSVRLDARERRLLAKRALTRSCLLIAEGWPARRCVVGRFDGVEGLERGAGHISTIRLSIGRASEPGRTVLIDSAGWRAGEPARLLRPPASASASAAARSLRAVSA